MGGFEGGIRVPAVISYPARNWTGGWRLQQSTSMMDIFPTISKITNIKPTEYNTNRIGRPNELGKDFLNVLSSKESFIFKFSKINFINSLFKLSQLCLRW